LELSLHSLYEMIRKTGKDLTNTSPLKADVKVATVSNLNNLYGVQTIDGVALVVGDKVLVKDQTDKTQNGIYLVQSEAWIRSFDFDTPETIVMNSFCLIETGTINFHSMFMMINPVPVTLGVTEIIWEQLSGPNKPAKFIPTSDIGGNIWISD